MSRSSKSTPAQSAISTGQVVGIGVIAAVGAAGFWASRRVHTPPAHQFLSKTGFMVDGVKVSRRTFQWPFQVVRYHSLTPQNHFFRIDNLFTADRVKLGVQVAATYRPRSPDTHPEGAVKYAENVGGDHDPEHQIGRNIMVAIEGNVRQYMLSLTAKELLDDAVGFRQRVIENAQKRLDEFGLEVPLLNLSDFEDDASGNYLKTITEKATAVTRADAARDVSEAQRREAEETNKNNRKKEESNRDYHVDIAGYRQTRELKDIAVRQEIEQKRIATEQVLAEKRLAQQTAQLRAQEMSLEQIAYERQMKKRAAEADGIRMVADAQLYKEQQEALGITAKLEAEAKGLQKLLSSSPDHPEHALRFLMLKDGLFEKLAKTNATAIADMKPKVNIWTTGAASTPGSNSTPYDGVRQLFTSLAPVWDVIQSQLDVKFPGSPNTSAATAASVVDPTSTGVGEIRNAILAKVNESTSNSTKPYPKRV